VAGFTGGKHIAIRPTIYKNKQTYHKHLQQVVVRPCDVECAHEPSDTHAHAVELFAADAVIDVQFDRVVQL
jgi:hypothetical protein